MDLAHNVLSSDNPENEYTIAGKRIGYQLQGVEERQRIIAEKLISDVMFYARMGKLTEEATVHCSNTSTQNTGNNYSSSCISQYSSSTSHPYVVQHLQSISKTPQEQYSNLVPQNQNYNQHCDRIPEITNYINNYQPNAE